MDFKDYYATLGVERTATQDELKRAYRKLARKYHPDVSKEPDAEARFKDIAEAHEALIDPERRAAYDDIARRQADGRAFEPPPGWDGGFEFSGRGADSRAGPDGAAFSDFFESLFGQRARGGEGRRQHASEHGPAQGSDHHAKLTVDLEDAYRGAQRTMSLRMPVVDAQGRATLRERQLEVSIPKGVRPGQHLRLLGQGAAGQNGAPAGDLYLEIGFMPHAVFRLDGSDVYFDLPVAPWEAALGATVKVPTPQGAVQLGIPAGSTQGRKLRLKGRGLPGAQAGDLYAVLTMAVPPADSEAQKVAWQALAAAYPDHQPRAALEA
ncbi:DnaJ C-terminal domain-containing protein [Roseateles sp.]|uniref:DnaJ C-terminal domain-containing protein n=1 Tax=Roseateles sp. TaxID=1971397 RepID=UPI0032662059